MKTEDLIAVLAVDVGARPRPVAVMLACAMGLGGLGSAILFAAIMGPRPDLALALAAWRFDAKIALLALAVLAAARECHRLSRPTAHGRPGPLAHLVIVLTAALVATELALTEPSEWSARLVGTNAWLCLSVIPLLSALPLAALFWAMRTGAPAVPARAGFAVGLLAASIGGLLYATHCFDDSPLFVVTWYSLAAIVIAGAGALIGHRALRW